MDCIEKDFENILKVELWPTGSLSGLPHIYEPTDVSGVTKPTGSGAATPIQIVHQPTSGKCIVAETMSIKTQSSKKLPGTMHECSVEFGTFQVEVSQLGYIRELEKPHEALVYFFGGQVWMIRTEVDGYAKSQKNDGMLTVTLRMVNGQGVTLITQNS